jgi:hypothetical protein
MNTTPRRQKEGEKYSMAVVFLLWLCPTERKFLARADFGGTPRGRELTHILSKH